MQTNRLIRQPKREANLYSRDDEENHIGQGLSDASFGLRLRYEFSRRFAPYVGHVWTRRFGGTADSVEASGGESGEHSWVAGVRFRSAERRVGKECVGTCRVRG